MDNLDIRTLFSSLGKARWDIAARTFGNSHATLIGILSEWWIRQNYSSHTVLDAPPSHGNGNAGWCDLILCKDDIPIGVVEVEGTKPDHKIKTLDSYFTTNKKTMSGISFGILLAYPSTTKGKGDNKKIPKPSTRISLFISKKHHP